MIDWETSPLGHWISWDMLDDICTLCLEVMVYIKHMQKSEVVRLKKLIPVQSGDSTL